MADTMTASEAADMLGYTRAYVVRLVQAGRLKGERVGPARRGVWQIDRASVETLLEELKQRPNWLPPHIRARVVTAESMARKERERLRDEASKAPDGTHTAHDRAGE